MARVTAQVNRKRNVSQERSILACIKFESRSRTIVRDRVVLFTGTDANQILVRAK